MIAGISPLRRIVSTDYYDGSLEGIAESKAGAHFYYRLAYCQWGVRWRTSSFELRFFYFWRIESEDWDFCLSALSKYEPMRDPLWFFMSPVPEDEWRSLLRRLLPDDRIPDYIYAATKIEDAPEIVVAPCARTYQAFDKSARTRSASARRLYKKIESQKVDVHAMG